MTVDPLFDISGRVMVVTGGLGQLGSRFTDALLSRDALVAVLDVVPQGPSQAGDQVYQADHPNLLVLNCDVTKRESLEAALVTITKEWSAPRGLINAAAVDVPPDASVDEFGPFEIYSEKSWTKMMTVNVTGTFLTCQVFGNAMAMGGGGSVINIGSTYGLVSPDQRIYEYRRLAGEPFYKSVAYSTSKSAILNLTRYLSTYWAEQEVRVNTLTFGGVFNDQDETFLRNYAERTPLGRMARPDEYNGAVIFLLSNASSYMTGSNLVIDGGWTAW